MGSDKTDELGVQMSKAWCRSDHGQWAEMSCELRSNRWAELGKNKIGMGVNKLNNYNYF